MTFLNPFVLFGLIASSIPIVIHLLNLRKLKKIEFSTLAFLKELQKNKIRKIKIKQILLLIIRTLIIIFLVLAFARPVLKGYLSAFGSHAKTSVVIIFDNSLSMKTTNNNGEIFKQAKYSANEIINLLEEGDDISIIKLTDPKNILINNSQNFLSAKKEIENLEAGFEFNTFSITLKSAANILAESKNFNKEIYIITDNQNSHYFLSEEELKRNSNIFDQNTRLFIIPIERNKNNNVSIEKCDIKNKIFEIEKPIELSSVIKNYGDESFKDMVVSVYNDGKRVSQKNINLGPNSMVTTGLSFTPKKPGFSKGYLEIEDDDFPYDNKFYFSYYIPEKIKILLCGEQETNNSIKLAFDAANNRSDSNNQKLFQYSETNSLSSSNLNSYDVLILSKPLNPSDVQKAKMYFQNGGRIILFGFLEMNNFNELITELGITSAKGINGNLTNKNSFLSFSKTDFEHPIFSGMFSQNKSTIESPEIYQSFIIQQNNFIKNVITLSNDEVFLADYKKDNKRALIYSISLNQNWSNITLKGIFVPLLFRSVFYMISESELTKSITIGETPEIKLNSNSTSIVIKDPEGIEEKVNVKSQSNFITFDKAKVPGTYEFIAGNTLLQTVSVNMNNKESDLSKIKDMDKYFNKFELKDRFKIVSTNNLKENLQQSRYGFEIWKYLLMIVIFLVIIEMLIARDSKKQMAGINK